MAAFRRVYDSRNLPFCAWVQHLATKPPRLSSVVEEKTGLNTEPFIERSLQILYWI